MTWVNRSQWAWSGSRKHAFKAPDPPAGDASKRSTPKSGGMEPADAIRQRPRFHVTYIMMAVLGVFLLHDLWLGASSVNEIPYSEFEDLVEGGMVDDIVVQGETIRAAEFVVYGHYSTGAADDLSRATDMAREMVTRYAMLPELGSA